MPGILLAAFSQWGLRIRRERGEDSPAQARLWPDDLFGPVSTNSQGTARFGYVTKVMPLPRKSTRQAAIHHRTQFGPCSRRIVTNPQRVRRDTGFSPETGASHARRPYLQPTNAHRCDLLAVMPSGGNSGVGRHKMTVGVLGDHGDSVAFGALTGLWAWPDPPARNSLISASATAHAMTFRLNYMRLGQYDLCETALNRTAALTKPCTGIDILR